MRKILCSVLCLLLSTPAMAALIWTANHGDYCMDDCTYQGCPVVSAIPRSDGDPEDVRLPDCTDEGTEECLMGADDDFIYVCYTSMEDYCTHVHESPKKPSCSLGCTDYGSNAKKCSRGRYTALIGGCGCSYEGSYKVTNYGCKAGFYPESGDDTPSIVCKPCPDGGTSSEFSSGINKCYKSSGTSFSNATGSGVIRGTCYY